MSIITRCSNCGFAFQSRAIKVVGSGNVIMQGNQESCPRCGALTAIEDGEYTFVNGVLSAFRAVNRESIERFREIIVAAEAGTISPEAAAAQAGQIHTHFAALVTQAFKLGIPALLIAIVALYLQWAANHDSAITSQQLVQELQAGRHVNEQILETLNRLDEAGRPPPISRQVRRRAELKAKKEARRAISRQRRGHA
jgi:hypothetical protein